MDHQPFQDVRPAAPVDSAPPDTIVQLFVPALQPFAALPQESLAALASDPAAVGLHGLLFPTLSVPALSPALRL